MQTLSSGGGLQDSTGVLTGVNVTVGPVGLDNESGTLATSANSLFSDYVFNNSAGNTGNATFTISGLTALARYDVYLYAGFANVANLSNTTIAGGTVTAFSNTGIFTSTNTRLYVVTADGSGNITGTMGANTNILAGFTLASVPEPSSVVLLTLGIAGMIGYECFPVAPARPLSLRAYPRTASEKGTVRDKPSVGARLRALSKIGTVPVGSLFSAGPPVPHPVAGSRGRAGTCTSRPSSPGLRRWCCCTCSRLHTRGRL